MKKTTVGVVMMLCVVMVLSFGADVFAQRFSRRAPRQTQQQQNERSGNTTHKKEQAMTFRVRLEYTSGRNEFWAVEEGGELPLVSKEPRGRNGEMLAGGPTIDTYTQNLNKSVTFSYEDGLAEAKTEFVLDNAAKTVKFKHNGGSSNMWTLVSCDGIEVKQTFLKKPRPDEIGGEVEELWTFGQFEKGKSRATAVFQYEFLGRKATKAVILIDKE